MAPRAEAEGNGATPARLFVAGYWLGCMLLSAALTILVFGAGASALATWGAATILVPGLVCLAWIALRDPGRSARPAPSPLVPEEEVPIDVPEVQAVAVEDSAADPPQIRPARVERAEPAAESGPLTNAVQPKPGSPAGRRAWLGAAVAVSAGLAVSRLLRR